MYIYIHSLLIQSLSGTRKRQHRLEVYISVYQGVEEQKQTVLLLCSTYINFKTHSMVDILIILFVGHL